MLKKYYLLAVLVALGLWLSSIATIHYFVLAGIVPRNQAERDFVTKLIYFSNESYLHELQMIKWHTVAILLFRVWQELFSWCYEDENVFISTCEICLFIPFHFHLLFIYQSRKRACQFKINKILGMWVAPDSLQILHVHCEIPLFGCGENWEFHGFLLPSIWVTVLQSLIEQHDSVCFGFCLVSFRASHILSSTILFKWRNTSHLACRYILLCHQWDIQTSVFNSFIISLLHGKHDAWWTIL